MLERFWNMNDICRLDLNCELKLWIVLKAARSFERRSNLGFSITLACIILLRQSKTSTEIQVISSTSESTRVLILNYSPPHASSFTNLFTCTCKEKSQKMIKPHLARFINLSRVDRTAKQKHENSCYTEANQQWIGPFPADRCDRLIKSINSKTGFWAPYIHPPLNPRSENAKWLWNTPLSQFSSNGCLWIHDKYNSANFKRCSWQRKMT